MARVKELDSSKFVCIPWGVYLVGDADCWVGWADIIAWDCKWVVEGTWQYVVGGAGGADS